MGIMCRSEGIRLKSKEGGGGLYHCTCSFFFRQGEQDLSIQVLYDV